MLKAVPVPVMVVLLAVVASVPVRAEVAIVSERSRGPAEHSQYAREPTPRFQRFWNLKTASPVLPLLGAVGK